MDAIAGLLAGPRASGAFVLRSLLCPPWSIRIEDRAPLSVAAVVRGTAWLVPDDAPPTRLDPGDVVIARGPDPYTMADDPGTAPQVVIHPGQHCAAPDGQALTRSMDLGLRTWGNDLGGPDVLVTGTYQGVSAVGRRLLGALPALLVVPGGGPLVDLLAGELGRDQPGQQVVLDRLVDLLVIATLRDWFARPEAEAPAWYRAHADPVVGHALRLIHHDPAHPWTVASLAAAAGVSRAALARRFTELVGEPPMAFLTGLRLALAADLLCEPDATVGAVARRVGYGSAFALSSAFKRVRGLSPIEHRAAG